LPTAVIVVVDDDDDECEDGGGGGADICRPFLVCAPDGTDSPFGGPVPVGTAAAAVTVVAGKMWPAFAQLAKATVARQICAAGLR
jgi:hypothetical protein